MTAFKRDGDSEFTYSGPYQNETIDLVLKHWTAIKTYRNKRRVSSIYNVTIRGNNITQTLQNFDTESILRDQTNKFKINASVGSILINNSDETMRYFHGSLGADRLFQSPKTIETRNDFISFIDELCSEDFVEFVTRARPDTAWSLHILTNITFYVFPIPNHTIGNSTDAVEHVRKNKAIVSGYEDKNGKPYTDNLCFFRALSYSRGNEKTLETSAKEYFETFLTAKCKSKKEFLGVSLSDLPTLESLFSTSINVYTLEMQKGEYIARLVTRSLANHKNQLNLHIQGTHFSWIKNLRLYTKSYKCVLCEKLVKSAGALKQHMSSCSSGATKFEHPFGAFTTPKTIYEKLKDVGIVLDESKRYYPYFAVFDCEVYFTSDKNSLPKNTPTISWNAKHNLASVSVCSNVAGFTTPQCFVNESDDEQDVVNRMLSYLQELSQTCKERLFIRYNDVFELLSDKKAKAVALEKNVMNGDGVERIIKMFERLEQELESYLSELLVFGFHSSNFDIPLIKSMLISQLVVNGEKLKYVVKKGTNYMTIATDSLKFLDICNFLAPGFSYSEYLKAFEVEEQKFVWIHEKFTSLDLLNRTTFPAYEEFYSSLKNSNISVEQYKFAHQVWKDENMKTLKDMLIYYNNADCKPFVLAIEKQLQFFRSRGLDIKTSISIPGLAIQYLFAQKDQKTSIMMFGEKNQDLYHLIKQNIRGGLSMVFSRYQECGVTKIKPEYFQSKAKTTASVFGYDVSALYLSLLMKPQPTGTFVRRRKANNFRAEKFCSNSSKAIEWIEWESHVQGAYFMHAMNGNEKTLGGLQLPVDGYCKFSDGKEKVLQFFGCYFHSHCCKAVPHGRYKDHLKDLENQKKTYANLSYLQGLGYNVQYIWECEFDRLKNENEELKTFCSGLNIDVDTRNILSEDQIIEEVKSGNFFGMVECDIYTPQHLKPAFEEFQPIPKHAYLSRLDIGKHMQNFAEKNNLLKRPTKTLLCSYFAQKILLATPLLQWYLKKGLIVSKIYQTVQFKPIACFTKFGEEVMTARREGDVDKSKKIVSDSCKLIGNSAYGKCLVNKEKHTSITYHNLEDPLVSAKINTKQFNHIDEIADNIVEIQCAKSKIKLDVPISVGFFVLEYAKLKLLTFYYDFLLQFLDDEDFCLIECDTDSLYFALSTSNLFLAIKPAKRSIFVKDYDKWFAKEYCELHKHNFFETMWKDEQWVCQPCCQAVKLYDSRTAGKFHLEFKGRGMVALCSKCYYCIGDKPKLSSKGISKTHNMLASEDYKSVLFSQGISCGVNKGFRIKNNVMYTYTQNRKGLNYMYGKRVVMDDHVTTRPTML